MVKGMSERLKDAFENAESTPDQNRSDAIAYCNDLRTPWCNVSTSLNRTVILMVAVAAAFELFRLDKTAKVTIAGFELTNLNVIEAALPVVFAYLYFEVVLLFMRYSAMGNIHTSLMKIAYPRIEANGLESWLAPPSRALLNVGANLGSTDNEDIALRSERFTFWVSLWSVFIFAFILPLAFEAYAFWALFRKGGITAEVWVALILTVILVAASVVTVFLSLSDPD